MENKKPLVWREPDGTILQGIPDLNRSIQEHNKFLKRYYHLAITFVVFIMIVIVWVLWQVKKYKVITFLIEALINGG